MADKPVFVDPFLGNSRANSGDGVIKVKPRKINTVTPVLDPLTGKTSVKVTDSVDLQSYVDSFKDDSGMCGALAAIARGLASPDDYGDDGNHSADVSGYPVSLNEAAAYSAAAKASGDEAAKQLGLGDYSALTSEELDELIKEKVAAILSDSQAKPAAPAVDAKESTK